jgi:ASC-1-like (ASCH) protein
MEARVHHMKLLKVYFDKIASGEKTVEMRLMDEKRQMISIGDRVVFSCEDDPARTVTLAVAGVQKFSDFSALARCYGTDAVGFAGDTPEEVGAVMERIYSAEAVARWGAAAIVLRPKAKEQNTESST